MLPLQGPLQAVWGGNLLRLRESPYVMMYVCALQTLKGRHIVYSI